MFQIFILIEVIFGICYSFNNMTLENIICPECKEEDTRVEEEHTIYNLAVGAVAGAYVGILSMHFSGNPWWLELMPAYGAGFYFADFPFGSRENYYCNNCDYHWNADLF